MIRWLDEMANHSKETIEVVRAALALAQRDVDLGLATIAEIEAIPRTRFAPVERKKAARVLIARGASEREAAEVLGVERTTIRRDLGKKKQPGGAKAPKNGAKSPNAEIAAAKVEHDKTAFLHRADLAARYAVYSGKVDKEVRRGARAAALAWNELANQMEKTDA